MFDILKLGLTNVMLYVCSLDLKRLLCAELSFDVNFPRTEIAYLVRCDKKSATEFGIDVNYHANGNNKYSPFWKWNLLDWRMMLCVNKNGNITTH